MLSSSASKLALLGCLLFVASLPDVSAQNCGCACAATVTVPGIAFFPPGILDQLQTLTGYNPLQITCILGMIQGPEQGRWQWWIDADGDPIWGYAEDIGDGRGVTFGIYGATTGQGYNDADILFGIYGKNLGGGSVSAIVKAIKAVANDPAWQLAMFKAYIQTYWEPTKTMLQPLVTKFGSYRALTFGAVLDTSMNAGIEDDSSSSWGSQHVVTEALKTATDEASFITRFLQLRGQYPTERSGEMTQRIAAWQKLLTAKQFNMNNVKILTNSYVYIPANWAVPINITDDGIGLRSAHAHSHLEDAPEIDDVNEMRGAATASSSIYTFAALLTVGLMAVLSPFAILL